MLDHPERAGVPLSGKQCASCAATAPLDVRFCGDCGAAFPEVVPPAPPAAWPAVVPPAAAVPITPQSSLVEDTVVSPPVVDAAGIVTSFPGARPDATVLSSWPDEAGGPPHDTLGLDHRTPATAWRPDDALFRPGSHPAPPVSATSWPPAAPTVPQATATSLDWPPEPGPFPSGVAPAPVVASKKTSKLPLVIGGVAAVAVIGVAAALAVPALRTLLAAPSSAAGAAVSATPSPAAGASSPTPAPSVTADARPTATVTVTQEAQPAATVVVPPAPANVPTFPTVRVSEGKECARTGSGPFAAAGTANASTSCPFAINVRDAYVANLNGADGTVRAYSPTTNLWYDMKCSGSQPVLCTGGKAGRVIIYGGDLKVG